MKHARLSILIGASSALWVVGAMSPAFARPAPPAEFKLVFEPEPGTTPPARVCFVSRAAQMRAAQVPGLGPLTEHATCPQGPSAPCEVPRGIRTPGCDRCPASGPHPDCRARLDTGRFPVDAYTVVCADDSTQPRDGGTVYVAAESVEAENPPAVFHLEVDGGRVRWSPINAVRRPSYTVVGGDFEISGLAWPRAGEAAEWVAVPLRRRCRCLTSAKAPGGAPIDAIEVDGLPTCHDVRAADGTLRVELPATAPGAVRSLRVRSADSEGQARWSGRWPDPEAGARLTRFGFELGPSCVRPAPAVCPQVSAPWSTCDRPAPVDGVCHYACLAQPGAALRLPVEVELRLEEPEVVWRGVVRSPGERLNGDPPPDRRVLTVHVPGGPWDTPGDAIFEAALTRSGERYPVLLDGPGPKSVPMADLRCGASVVAVYSGSRPFESTVVRVGEGGAVHLPPPEETARTVTMSALAYVGYGQKGTLGRALDRDTQSDGVIMVSAAVSLRYRLFGRPWFVAARLSADLVPDGLGLGGVEGGDGVELYAGRDQRQVSLISALVAGYAWTAFDAPLELYGGLGFGPTFAMGDDGNGQIRSAVGLVGLRRPLTARLDGWALVAEVRGTLGFHDPPLALLTDDADSASLADPTDLAISGLARGEAHVTWQWTLGAGARYQF